MIKKIGQSKCHARKQKAKNAEEKEERKYEDGAQVGGGGGEMALSNGEDYS